jgi:hypothetical protein
MTAVSTAGSNFGFSSIEENSGEKGTDRTLTYIAAISEALREEMRRDPNVCC